jgi:hypothetical protein
MAERLLAFRLLGRIPSKTESHLSMLFLDETGLFVCRSGDCNPNQIVLLLFIFENFLVHKKGVRDQINKMTKATTTHLFSNPFRCGLKRIKL